MQEPSEDSRAKRMLLISSRPALVRPASAGAGEVPQSDWALPSSLRERLQVEEWRFPAFHLHVQADAAQRMSAWTQRALGSRALIVCVSPGSLELLWPLLPQPWPDCLLLGLMGDGSAAKAMALGVPEQALVYPSQRRGESQDSGGLLARLGALDPFDTIMLLKGNGGNLDLAPALEGLCRDVEVVQAYRRTAADAPSVNDLLRRVMQWREPRAPAASAASSIAPVVFYLTSSEAVDVLAPVITSVAAGVHEAQRSGRIAIITTHPRIEERAIERGLSLVVCLSPGVDSLAQWLADN